MSLKARIYWTAIVLSGWSMALWSFGHPHLGMSDLPRLILYLLAAISTSGLKVRLPGVYCTLSMNYVFIIAGLMDLHVAGGILVGMSGVLCQTFYKCKDRPKWQHLLFNLAAIAITISAASICFEVPFFRSLDPVGISAMVLASLVYFGVNTLIMASIIGITSGKTVLAVWREAYLWTSPQYFVGGVVGTGFELLAKYIGWAGMLFVLPIVYLVYRTYDIYLSRVQEQQEHIAEMAKLHLRTIEALALAIDAKDDTTAAHLRRVQVYASEVGKELQLGKLEMEALNAAAILHDIGKLAVPEHIISKPGRLTPEEFEKMKIHPIVGAEILERVEFPYPVVPIVRCHHEKYDGSGYPAGLKGEEIPIGARILSAVDCLDALASDRQYRKALPLDDAIQIVIKEAGNSFDPKVVDILARRYRELEALARSESENAQTAKLSNNVKVERGARPAAGFAEEEPAATIHIQGSEDFRSSISSARREFQTLIEIANDLGTNLSLSETLALLAVRLEKTISHDAVVVYVVENGHLVPRHAKGESQRLFSSLRIPLGQGLSGWVAENDVPVVNGNPSVEAGYLNDASKTTHLRSAICVPLRGRDRAVGVIALYSLQPDAFTADHRRILLSISAKVGSVVENALYFERIQTAARIDELTGLLNAATLFDEMAQKVRDASEKQSSLAVLVLDLNGFKRTNDEHGHVAGNRVLQHIGRGLSQLCREDDLVARLGGDEFVLVLSNWKDDLSSLLERIDKLVTGTPTHAGTEAPLSTSVGCAVYPDDSADPEALLEIADERMYSEKRKRSSARPVIAFPKPAISEERSVADVPHAKVGA